MSDESSQRAGWWSLGAIIVAVVVAGVLHARAGHTFPRPWPDEAHFITPALTLAADARLAVPELNAPVGIFWVPTGYYFAQLPLILLGVDPLLGGRLLSMLGIVAFACAVFVVAARAGIHRAVAFGAVLVWLCMPRVVAIGNIARMEGLILGLVGACLWLISTGRWPLAMSVSLLAPLLHPIGVVVPVAVAAGALVRSGRRRWTGVERAALAVVAALWVAEIAYFALHADVAAAHLRFQFTRKAGRAITAQWWQWLLLAATAAGGVATTWRWRRAGDRLAALQVALALAGGFVLIDVVGREMWYEPLGRETSLLLAGLVAAAALRRVAADVVVRQAAAAAAAILLLFGAASALRSTLAGGWYGMGAIPGSSAEWYAFTDDAIGELQRLDAERTTPAVVVVDPLSGFGHELVARPWRMLRFVQPTPATPVNTAAADYVLATPGAPFTTDGLVTQWGRRAPVVELRSPRGIFTLQLYDNPASR